MRILIAICLVLTTMVPSLARADLDAKDRATLNSIIEDFIRNNPEIVRDTLIALAAREEAERKQTGLAKVRDDQGDPVMGNANGTITLYEFSDYNCGYCKRIFKDLQAVLAEQPDVRLVVKEFPILAETSVLAAKAAIAAHRQGKFRELHISMMTWRGKIDGDSIDAAVQKAGLDKNRLRKDMEDELTAAILSKTRAAAAALEVKGTPALIIGETIIPGAINKNEILDLINQTRAAKN